jgi:hypothetical protein
MRCERRAWQLVSKTTPPQTSPVHTSQQQQQQQQQPVTILLSPIAIATEIQTPTMDRWQPTALHTARRRDSY